MICTIGCEKECVFHFWTIASYSVVMAILLTYIIYLKWIKKA